MKRILVAAAALFFTTAALQAQTKQDAKPQHHKGFRAGKSFNGLNLTDEQKKQAKELNDNYRKQLADLKNNTSMSVGDYRSKTAAIRKEQREKFQALLTPEQKNQVATQRKQAGEKMKLAQGKRFEQMKSSLGLTEEQTRKLKEGQAGVQSKIKSIREDKSLSDDQKKEQVRNVMKEQREQFKSVLTPDQLQKLKSGRKGRNNASTK